MIANCAQLGLDWQTCSASAYLEGLEAWQEAHAPQDGNGSGKRLPAPTDGLKRFMSAHGVGGNG